MVSVLKKVLPVLLGVVAASLVFAGLGLMRTQDAVVMAATPQFRAQAAETGDGQYIFVGTTSLLFAAATYLLLRFQTSR
jgi:uncharacterized membrane protein YqjE